MSAKNNALTLVNRDLLVLEDWDTLILADPDISTLIDRNISVDGEIIAPGDRKVLVLIYQNVVVSTRQDISAPINGDI